MAYVYKTMKVNGKTKLVHRHLMERKMGRKLLSSEHVHHRNGDKWDNRLSNLELLPCKKHLHLHKQKYPLTKDCLVCGVEFTPHKTKRKRAKTCSKKCAYDLRWRSRRVSKMILKPKALVAANSGDMAVWSKGERRRLSTMSH